MNFSIEAMSLFRPRIALPGRKAPFASLAIGSILMLVSMLGADGLVAQEEQRTTFDDHAKAVFRQRCSSCHNPNKKSGDLDVTNFGNLMQGGSSGTVIEPGDADGSYLMSLVKHDEEPVMPPGGRIPDAEIEILAKWINEGAPENQGSKVTVRKKTVATVMDPVARPETVATFPHIPVEPVQHSTRAPAVVSMAVSPWSTTVAVAGQNQVVLYDTSTLRIKGVLPFPEGTVNVVRFSRTGSILMAAGGEHGSHGVAVLWDVNTGERIGTFGDELDSVLAADISPDHKRVALGGPGRVVNVYDLNTGELQYSLSKHTEWVTAIEFSVDGVLLASGDRNGGLYVFEALTGREYLTLKGHEQTINDISWRSDSNVVASACDDTTIRLWEMNNGAQIKSWNAHGGGATSVEYARDGTIVSTGDDRITRLWQGDGTKIRDFPALDDIGLTVSWCNETARCLAGDYTGVIRVWNGADATELGRLTPNPVTLETRITSATANVTARQAELDPVAADLASTTDSVNQASQLVQSTQQELAAAQARLAEAQATLTTATEAKTAAEAQLAQLRPTLTTTTQTRSLVAESLAKLQEALAALPDDAALTQQSAALTARIAEFDQQIASVTSAVTAEETKVSDNTQLMETMTAKVAAEQTSVQELEAKLQQANEALAPLVAHRDELTAKVNALQAALQAAQAELAHWDAERTFLQNLQALQTRMAEAESSTASQQEQLNQALSALEQAQAAVDAARNALNANSNEIQTIQSEIEALRQQ